MTRMGFNSGRNRSALATVGSALERTRNDGLPDLSARQERTA